MNKKTAVKNNRTPAQNAAKRAQLLKQNNIALKKFAQIGKHLEYRNCGDGNLHLFDKSTDTGIMIKRSHEGYSPFSCWYVIDNGKIKKDYPIKEQGSAMAKGISVHLEKLTNGILKTRGGGNG